MPIVIHHGREYSTSAIDGYATHPAIGRYIAPKCAYAKGKQC